MQSRTRAGIGLALGTALISGISIPINKVALEAVGSVTTFTAAKNLLVGILLLGFVLPRLRALRVRELAARPRIGLGAVALIGGSIPFLLFFQGLSMAGAPSAALIHKTLFIWVAIIAIPLLGERLGAWGWLGLGAIAVGQLTIGWPAGWGWGTGEWMILGATLFWAAETILLKRLLPDVPVSVAAAARMAGGGVVLWGWLLATGGLSALAGVGLAGWAWILLTSVLLLGYVTTWYGALDRAPATVVTSVLALGAVVSAIVATAQGTIPSTATAVGLVVLTAGAIGVAASGRLEAT